MTDDLVERLNMVDATMNPMTLVIVAREAARYIERLETEVRVTAGWDRAMQELADKQEQRIEELEQSLTFAAGIIAAIEPLYDGPEQVLKIITAEGKGMAAALREKKDD